MCVWSAVEYSKSLSTNIIEKLAETLRRLLFSFAYDFYTII